MQRSRKSIQGDGEASGDDTSGQMSATPLLLMPELEPKPLTKVEKMEARLGDALARIAALEARHCPCHQHGHLDLQDSHRQLTADLAAAMARITVLEQQGPAQAPAPPCTSSDGDNRLESTPSPAGSSPSVVSSGSQTPTGDTISAVQSCPTVEASTQTDTDDIPSCSAVEMSAEAAAPHTSSSSSSSSSSGVSSAFGSCAETGAVKLPSPKGDADPIDMGPISLLFFPSLEEGASMGSESGPSSLLDAARPDTSDNPGLRPSSPAAVSQAGASVRFADSLHQPETIKARFSLAVSRAASLSTAADSPGPAEYEVQETLPASGAAQDSLATAESAATVPLSAGGAAADSLILAKHAVKKTPLASGGAAGSPAPVKISITASGAAADSPAVPRRAKRNSNAARGSVAGSLARLKPTATITSRSPTAIPAVPGRRVKVPIAANGAAANSLTSGKAATGPRTSAGAAGGSRLSGNAAAHPLSTVSHGPAADRSSPAVQGSAASSLVPDGVGPPGRQGRLSFGWQSLRRLFGAPWAAQPVGGAPPSSDAPPSHAAETASDLEGWLEVEAPQPRAAARQASPAVAAIMATAVSGGPHAAEDEKGFQVFTTAGVSKRISIYEYSAIMGNPGAETHRPSQELVTRSKLSCLTWNKHLGSSESEGVVHVWDIATGQNVAEYEGRRFCSVDFCPENPKLLMSGSNDGIVKIWSTKQQPISVLEVDVKANVCCAKYNPGSSYEIAVGAADHTVLTYDLRKSDRSVHTYLRGHPKAGSYVRYLNTSELVSASSDSTSGLWDTKACTAGRVLSAANIEEDFVSLSVHGEVAARRTANEVCAYCKAMFKPVCRSLSSTAAGVVNSVYMYPAWFSTAGSCTYKTSFSPSFHSPLDVLC